MYMERDEAERRNREEEERQRSKKEKRNHFWNSLCDGTLFFFSFLVDFMIAALDIILDVLMIFWIFGDD